MGVELTALEVHLADKSYIEGFTPSQADVSVYSTLSSPPSSSTHPNSSRWYTHITSYSSSFQSLPGDSSKSPESYLAAAAAAASDKGKGKATEAEGDDDDIDLFGSDDEEVDEEAEKVKAQRLEEYNKKKAGKTKPVAKSIVTLEVKPWDDETDMKKLEESVRSVEKDGLVWGASKLVPVGYGVFKLQINLVVEDDKVSTDELQEELQEFEDYIQSSDVLAMQKL